MATTLKGTARAAGANLTIMRKEGLVPAVVYGHGRETLSITVPSRDFLKVLKEVGESGTVELELAGGTVTVLIHEVVNDAIRQHPEHVDFLAIDVTKPIQVHIPIEFTGVAPAVKGGLGVLVKVIHEVEVKGLPTKIPHSVAVDISGLDVVDSHVTIADLKLPAGVEALAKPDAIVVNISSIKEEKEEAPGAIDFSQIEVEKKGKKEEEAPAA